MNLIGEDLFPMWMEVQRADSLAQSLYRRGEKEARQEGVRKLWEEIVKEGQCVSLKGLQVNGGDLIAAGMKPGKKIGLMLEWLLEQVLEKPELNQRDKLLELAETKLAE